MNFRLGNLKHIFAFCLVPVAWIALEKSGVLEKFELALLDMRFQYRGEIELDPGKFSPLPGKGSGPGIVYVDFDQRAVSSPDIGERPWDRAVFAQVGQYLLDERVGASAVGFDFIFSQNSASKMVLEESVFRSDRKLGELVRAHPEKVVFGASYNNVSFEFKGDRISSNPPLFYAGNYHQGLHANYPEGPTYPIRYYDQEDGKFYGRQGLLNVDMLRGKGVIPRWAPLFFPTEGDAHAKHLLLGHYFANPLEIRELEAEADLAFALEGVEEATQANQALNHLMEAGKAVQQAEAELSQLEEVAKADPSQAEELAELIEEQKEIKALSEEEFLEAYRAIGGGEEKPDLTLTVALLETDTKLQGMQLQLAEKDLEAILLMEEHLQATPFDRSHLSFGKDFEKGHWHLKDGEQVVVSIPGSRAQPHFYHMALALVLAAYGLDWQAVEVSGSHLAVKDGSGKEIVNAPLADKQLLETNWFSKWKVSGKWVDTYLEDPYNPRCSLIDVLNYGKFFFDDQIRDMAAKFNEYLAEVDEETKALEAQVEANLELGKEAEGHFANLRRERGGLVNAKESFDSAEEFFSHFRDAIVLVGPADPTFQDLAPTPFDDAPVPKVGFIGNVLKTLLSGEYLKRAPDWAAVAGVVGLCLPVILLGFCGRTFAKYFRVVGVLLVLLYPLAAFQAFGIGNWILPVVAPTGAVFCLTFAMIAFRRV